MDINSIKTKDSFHNYVTIKQSDNTSPIEVLLCDSKGALLSNLNEKCTVSIYDAISREVRQVSDEQIVDGVLSFKIVNDLFPYTHKLEVTTYSGVKFPADDDFQIFVSESHNSKLLNIIKSIPMELALKVVTQQVMDRFITADENFRTLSESMSTKINELSGSLLSYIKKGEVSVSDIDFNKGKLDGNAFADSFLKELGNGNIVTTSLIDSSVTTNKLADLAVTSQKLSTDAIERTVYEQIIRNVKYDSLNVVLYPTNNMHLTTYASAVGDTYYSSIASNGATPANSFDNNKSVTLSNAGYFFYTVKKVGKFLETGKVSFLLENSSAETLVQFRFFNDSNTQVGNITPIPLIKNGVYMIENVTIPTEATKIELRIDNRNTSKSTTAKNLLITPYERIVLEDDKLSILNKTVNVLDNAVQLLNVPEKKKGVLLKNPNGFTGTPKQLVNRIYKDAYGMPFTDYDVTESKLYKGKTYYVDYKNGSDYSDGLTKETAFKSFKKAAERTDVGEICFKGGKHFRYNSTWPTTITRAINMTSYDGIAQLIMADDIEWSLVSGYTNVYTIKRGAVGKVVDLSRKEGTPYKEFKKVNSIDEVQSTVDSYYYDGSNVYARYSVQPKKDELVALLQSNNVRITTNLDYFYIQDIELIGGIRPYRNESEVSEEYFKNVKFLHATEINGNGLEIVGGRTAIAQKCIASSNVMDGFNYHIGATGSIPIIAEIDCLAEENGIDKGAISGKSNNGSTLHDGIKGVRINGIYTKNDGGNIADVNPGTQSWNLGVTAFDSYQNADFMLSDSEMWLDGCTCYGSVLGLQVGNNSTAYVRNSNLQHELVVEGASKVEY